MIVDNPLLQPWDAPHGLPPFAQLRPEHFEPALRQAMAEHRAEVAAIAGQAAPPDFDNTLAALDRSGRRLGRIAAVFFNLASAHTNGRRAQVGVTRRTQRVEEKDLTTQHKHLPDQTIIILTH